MADISVIVDPDGTGDYTSLSSAEATEQATYADLVAGNNTMTFNWTSSGGTADTQYCTVAGWTSNATYKITINNLDDHGGTWNTNAARISVNNTNTALVIDQDYTECYGLQVENAGGSARRGFMSSATGVLVDRCIVRLDNTYSFANCYGFTGTGTCYIRNSLGYGFGTNFGRSGILSDNGTVYAHNCTMCDLSNFGYDASADGTLNVKNCVAFNVGTPYDVSSADYCAYDSGADPGTNGVDISGDAGTDLFADYNNDDFHVKGTGSSLYDAGIDLSADGNLAVTEDIDQEARTQWDIGCDEYIVAGGGLSIPIAMHHYKMMRH